MTMSTRTEPNPSAAVPEAAPLSEDEVAAMRRAQEETETCDLFLAVGSSLVVYPAAGFPVLARRNGAILAIINREETALDDEADIVLRGDIGDILAPFASSA